ncbi:MAG: response regulator [Bacteroidales bacterium]|nr:response regulator [Bacteroidales bacterium]
MQDLKILIVDDVPDDAELVAMQLKQHGIKFSWKYVDNAQKLKNALIDETWDIVITDYSMPGFDGIEALRIVNEYDEDLPVIMVSGTIGEDMAVEAMKKGVHDYMMKNNMLRLGPAVLREIKDAENRQQHKKAREALVQSEEKFRLLVENAPVGVSITTLDGEFLTVNKAYCDITGYTERELLNMTIIELTVKKFKEKTVKIIYELIEEEIEKTGIEKQYMRKDGKIIDVVIHGTIKRDEKGKPEYLIGLLQDITDIKKDERIRSVIYNIANATDKTQDLNEFNAKVKDELSKVIDTKNFYIAFYEKETDTFSLPFIEDEKDKFTSFSAGKTLTGFVIKTKKSLFATKDIMKELERSGEIELVGTDSEIWLGIPLLIKGEITGVLVVQSYDDKYAYKISDINMLEIVSHQISASIERKKAELDLKEALRKAKESDRLKSAFLSTISHELRTPLNAIIGFSEIINEDIPKDEILDFVKSINKSGYLLFEIIEDILDVTDIESGKSRVTKEEFPVDSVLQELYPETESILEKEKKQHLELKYCPPPDSIRITINTNKSKFKKILILLLKNAIKFTEKGFIEYGFKPEKEELVFYVKDTGIGISEDERDIVFEKFRQVDDTHTRKYGGVGLGLTLVKKLIELLDGRIWFDSEPGKGSVFYFSLPYGKPEEELSVEKKTGEKKEKKLLSDKTILIVEDENSNYLLLEKLLKLENANTIWARNGEESIEKFKENKNIDLILMDLKMPVMDGYEATRQIKQLSENLPIIALTAYTESESIEKAKSKGFDDYLEKPIKRAELFERICEFIS